MISGVHSQEYYRVNDSDGYVNLRLKPDVNSKISQRIEDKECVIGLYFEGSWIKSIYFSLPARVLDSGFIHNSRLIKDDSCKVAPNIKAVPNGAIALESLNQHENFEHASKWFKANKKDIADDGYFAEAYSDYVMKTLANSFIENVSVLNRLRTNEPDFIRFVLKHIDPTGSFTDLENIAKNESKCNSIKPSEICKKIINNAKMALQDF